MSDVFGDLLDCLADDFQVADYGIESLAVSAEGLQGQSTGALVDLPNSFADVFEKDLIVPGHGRCPAGSARAVGASTYRQAPGRLGAQTVLPKTP